MIGVRPRSSLTRARRIGSDNKHSRNQFNILSSQAEAEANGTKNYHLYEWTKKLSTTLPRRKSVHASVRPCLAIGAAGQVWCSSDKGQSCLVGPRRALRRRLRPAAAGGEEAECGHRSTAM